MNYLKFIEIITDKNKVIMDKPIISVKNAFILAFITVISFAVISVLLRNYTYPRLVFGDIVSPVIELLVVIALFYATIYLSPQGKRIQRGWLLIAVAFSFYVIGDILWANMRLDSIKTHLYP